MEYKVKIPNLFHHPKQFWNFSCFFPLFFPLWIQEFHRLRIYPETFNFTIYIYIDTIATIIKSQPFTINLDGTSATRVKSIDNSDSISSSKLFVLKSFGVDPITFNSAILHMYINTIITFVICFDNISFLL